MARRKIPVHPMPPSHGGTTLPAFDLPTLFARYAAAHPHERERADGFLQDATGIFLHPNCLGRCLAWVRAQRLVPGLSDGAWDTLREQMRQWAAARDRERSGARRHTR